MKLGTKTVYGGSGDDVINGGIDDDKLHGDTGNDQLDAGAGNDSVDGGDGNDRILTSDGNDFVLGGDGNDEINSYLATPGDLASVRLNIFSGTKTVYGGSGDDVINGGSDNDKLYGEAGDDYLYGGAGNDTLISGTGNDFLWGGKGDDVYYLEGSYYRIDDESGNDTAYVSTSFLKIPSFIENVVYLNDAKPLPYWIDALLEDSSNPSTLSKMIGSSRTYYYSFPKSIPTYDTSAIHAKGWEPFTALDQLYATTLMGQYAAVLNISFVSTDNASGTNTIVFANNTQLESKGFAFYPSVLPAGSDIFLNSTYKNTDMRPVLIHELGHGLGLKHPFDEPDVFDSVATPPYLPTSEDSRSSTVMSYSGSNSISLREFDIAALQYLYGVNPAARAGNDTYVYSSSFPNFIWDGNGTDVIDASTSSKAVHVYLEPGYWGYGGDTRAGIISSRGQITVNFGTVIENLIGSAFSDELTGNSASNIISGGYCNDSIKGLAGNDTLSGDIGRNVLDGGDGIDIAKYSSGKFNWAVSKQGSSLLVTDIIGITRDTLISIERMWFQDTKLAFDLDGNAGQAVKIAAAIYGKASVNDTKLIGSLMNQLDSGLAFNDVIQSSITSKFSNTVDPWIFVTTVYKNVAGVNPDLGTLGHYASLLVSGVNSPVELALIGVEHPANISVIQGMGLPVNGLQYT